MKIPQSIEIAFKMIVTISLSILIFKSFNRKDDNSLDLMRNAQQSIDSVMVRLDQSISTLDTASQNLIEVKQILNNLNTQTTVINENYYQDATQSDSLINQIKQVIQQESKDLNRLKNELKLLE